MIHERPRRSPKQTDVLHPAIVAAGLELQNTGRLQSASGLFMIVVNMYQGLPTNAEAFRCLERRAFYCGERLNT